MKEKDEEKRMEVEAPKVGQSYDQDCRRRSRSTAQNHETNNLERRCASAGRVGERCKTL